MDSAKDPLVDETLDKVRHLRTSWGSGDNSRFVKNLDRLKFLTTLDLCLPTCCGGVAVEDLEVLKGFTSLQRLGLRMVPFSLRWVDYLPNPDKLTSLTIVPQFRTTRADLSPLLKFRALKRLDLIGLPGPDPIVENRLVKYSLSGAEIAALASLKELQYFAAGVCDADVSSMEVLKRVPRLRLRVNGSDIPVLKGLGSSTTELQLELRQVKDGQLKSLEGMRIFGLVLAASPDLTAEGLAPLTTLNGVRILDIEQWRQPCAKAWEYFTSFKDLRVLSMNDGLGPLVLAFDKLESLTAGGLTDSELEVVSRLKSLVRLSYSSHKLKEDQGVRHLPALLHLRALKISGSHHLNDGAVGFLRKMTYLQWLEIGPHSFTPEGRESLEKALSKTSLEIGSSNWR